MAYTWTNKTKTGGVGLTGKIVQKGKDDFPLMYANDLDWANVEVENGVNLNTTDDLLDYIKGGNSGIIGRINELELSNAGYEIRCDKSVCYVGDTLSRVPVWVYKNGTLLSWPDIQADGITLKSPITKPTGANDLIQFTSNGQWLNGTANKAGAYVFEFVKGAGTASEVCVASFMLTVLMKPLGSYQTTIYISSQSKPETPTGGSYDFGSKSFTAPTGWSTSTTGLSTPIWFSTGTVFSDGDTTPTWSEPCIYMDSEIVNTENEYRVKEVVLYKACCGPYTDSSSNTHTKVIPAAPTSTRCYTFNINPANDQFVTPSGWHETPEAAIEQYKNNQQIADLKTNYRVWKTYNSYRITVNKLTNPNTLLTDSYSETGWINPVEYLNIDQILEDTKTYSQRIFDTAIQRAKNDLQQAENLATIIDAVNVLFAWRIVGDGNNSLPSEYTELVDDNDTTSAQHLLYDTFTNRYTVDGVYDGHLEMMNDDDNICTPSYQMKAVRFTHIRENNVDNGYKWVAYIPTTTEIRNQISALDTQTQTLSTAVSAMNPDEIRLQVSKGFKKDVTWTEVGVNEWNSAITVMEEDPEDDEYDFWYYGVDMNTRSKRHGYKLVNGVYEEMYATYDSISGSYDYISGLPVKADVNNGGYVYGHYYIVRKSNNSNDCKYFRCDYPISTGFANILADRVSFGVTDNLSDSGNGRKGSLVNMTIDGVGSTGDKIVLDGDTIANAIYGKSLNINNTTYLCSDGDVYFGVPTGANNSATINPDAADKTNLNTGTRSSRFNKDGSGQLCGGNINWTNNGVLYVKEAHIGESNSDWLIKTLVSADNIYDKDGQTRLMCPVIFAKDSISGQQYHDELFITPQYIFACNSEHESDRNYDAWRIERDGTAMFAKGHATFNADGSAVIGNQTTNITMSNSGAISLTGVEVNISSANSTTIASGIIGTPAAVAILLDGQSGNVGITGKLNTADLSVGNGACFFKGTDTALDPVTLHGHNYGLGTRGAGHLAKGNIWWDADGNLSIGGQLRLKGTSLEWGGAVQEYELVNDMFDNNNQLGSNFYYTGALYHLPDPEEYLGREIFVSVYIQGKELHDIFNRHPQAQGQYWSGYQCFTLPCFDINSSTDNNKWIKWGVYSCKYNSCEINHNPKYYQLGVGSTYTAGTHQWTSSDVTKVSEFYSVSDSPSSHSHQSGQSTIVRQGLYLIPTDVKVAQMNDLASNNSSEYITLRMRCQAKKMKMSAKYYWEIQTSDFMPCFDTGEYAENVPSGNGINNTGLGVYDLTAESFYQAYESKIASTSLAFEEYNIQ